MNRHNRRAQSSVGRKAAPVSLKLLQDAHEKLQQEAQQLRNVLFSLAKEHGRLRFSKRTLESLTEMDGINAELDGDNYIITYQKHPGAQDASSKETA